MVRVKTSNTESNTQPTLSAEQRIDRLESALREVAKMAVQNQQSSVNVPQQQMQQQPMNPLMAHALQSILSPQTDPQPSFLEKLAMQSLESDIALARSLRDKLIKDVGKV